MLEQFISTLALFAPPGTDWFDADSELVCVEGDEERVWAKCSVWYWNEESLKIVAHHTFAYHHLTQEEWFYASRLNITILRK